MAWRRASRRDVMPSLHPLDVLARARVHLDPFAFPDEQRDLDHVAGLDRGGLHGVGLGVALHRGLGLGDRERHGGRKLDGDRRALMNRDLSVGALRNVVGGVADHARRHGQLLVALHVHEGVVVAVAIQVLHLLAFDDGQADLHAGIERALDHGAGPDVAELRAHERATLPRLDMLKLHDLEQRAVEVERHPVLQVVGRDAHRTTISLVEGGIARQPSDVTSTMSSIRTPPRPGTYTPGSIVTTAHSASSPSASHRRRGSSWISRPTPWPRPWGKLSPKPASSIAPRAARSTTASLAPARTVSIARRCAIATRSCIVRSSGLGSPNATVRVISEW